METRRKYMQEQGMHFYISGQVQGVFLRANTQNKAIELGLTGWVQNLPDGRVEVMAYGDSPQLKALHQWLQDGPPVAKIESIEVKTVPWQKHPLFEIKS